MHCELPSGLLEGTAQRACVRASGACQGDDGQKIEIFVLCFAGISSWTRLCVHVCVCRQLDSRKWTGKLDGKDFSWHLWVQQIVGSVVMFM